MAKSDADRGLLFGVLALQNGLIDQDALIAAFRAWSRDKGRTMADHLVGRGDLDAEQCALLEGLVAQHLRKHGDAEKSLAAIPAGRFTRERLGELGDAELNATLMHVGSGSADAPDADRTTTYAVGSATADGRRFRVLRPHAQGGLGAVFVALDGELNREVALKQILDRHADDPTSRQRFLLEAEITGGLEHPGIVPIYGLGTYGDGRPYYAMRFIRGDSLKQAIEHFHAGAPDDRDAGRRSLELRRLLRRFTDVCNAIDYAHGRGVLHRDIKPGNVIVGRHGETLVVDWGLAKATGRVEPGGAAEERPLTPSSASGSAETLPGSALGTPAYMSPEQAVGDVEHLGPRSDVYGLGATLYCILTGTPPFDEADVGTLLRAVGKGDFPPPRTREPSIAPALEAICLKAMARQPADRYDSARALSEDIDRWLADEPVSAHRERLAERAGRWMRRRRTTVTATAAAVLVALAGLAIVLAISARANRDLRAANSREKARFELALEAIKMFHSGVSDDLLLKQQEFGELRSKLLGGARDFYGKLERLLEGQPDRRSRAALGTAYFELGELTSEIGSNEEALAVHRRGLAVSEELAREEPADAEARVKVARGFLAMAWQLRRSRSTGQALATLEKARLALQALTEADPTVAVYRADLARCHLMLGVVLNESDRQTESLAHYERARTIFEDLSRAHPSVPRYPAHVATLLNNSANALRLLGRRDEAITAYQRAITIQEALARAYPAVEIHRADLARSLTNLGHLLHTERRALALAALQRARDIQKMLLAANPHIATYKEELGSNEFDYALILQESGRAAESLDPYERARAIYEDLTRTNPNVPAYRAHLATTHNNTANSLMFLDRPTDAIAAWTRAQVIEETLVRDFPDSAGYRIDLARTLTNLARAFLDTDRRAEMMAALDRASAVLKPLLSSRTLEGFRLEELTSTVLAYGLLLNEAGRTADAAVEFHRAFELMEHLPAAAALTLYNAACAHSILCGLTRVAGPTVAAAESRSEGDRAMETLRRAIAAGYRDAANMRVDRDLDSVRARADFQDLLLDAAFPADPFETSGGRAGAVPAYPNRRI